MVEITDILHYTQYMVNYCYKETGIPFAALNWISEHVILEMLCILQDYMIHIILYQYGKLHHNNKQGIPPATAGTTNTNIFIGL